MSSSSATTTNSKKRTAAAAALDESPVAEKAEVKTEKTEKKTKKAAAPKKEKKPKEEKKATAESGDGAADASADEPAKKKRKVVRFNPHNPCDYLDLRRYWKNHESLRIGLLKAQAAENAADEAGDKDKADEAAASVARYTGVLQRLESRRSDVMMQLKSVAELLTHGQLADPLLSRLVPAFDPRPEAEKDDDAAPAAAAGAAGAAEAEADAEPKEPQA